MARNRKIWRTQPVLEGLEDRRLLSGFHRGSKVLGPGGRLFNEKDLAKYLVQRVNIQNNSFVEDRRIIFRTNEGGFGTITLYGLGTLRGTKYDPATGLVDIIFDDTNRDSRIVGKVRGGTGRVDLRVMRDRDLSDNTLSAAGTNQLGTVNLKKFDLVDGGRINLFGGIGTLFLGTIGANTVVNVTALPLTPEQLNPSPQSPTLSATFVQTANGVELTGVGGLTVPGAIGTSSSSTVNVPAPGVNLIVEEVNGTPHDVPFANPQVFGYDPLANALVRFDASTGAQLQAIPITIPNPGQIQGEVGLGRYRGSQVALVAVDTTVQAYDVITGGFVGDFMTSNVLDGGAVDGVGSTDRNVALLSSETQQVQIIDLNASIDNPLNLAVPAVDSQGDPIEPFTPTRDFILAGGLTGAAGLNSGFVTGAAHFDTFTPDQFQAGVLTGNTLNDQIVETARTQLTSPSTIISNVPTNPDFQPFAFGSVDLFPAIVTAFSPLAGTNTMTLYNPATFASVGTVNLLYPNRLTGLSESFHPELEGGAIINANGIVNQFTTHNVTGLVFNTIGYLNLISVSQSAVSSTFIAEPIGMVDIHDRENVQIFSTTDRTTGTSNGVTLVPGLRPQGPLFLPGPPRA